MGTTDMLPFTGRVVTVRTIQQRCPICEGRRFVPGGFYTGLPIINPEPCQQCGGTGMIAATETTTHTRE